MSRIVRRAGLAGAMLVGALLIQSTLANDIRPDPRTHARHDRIVGLWDVDVAVGQCGGPLGPPFQALHQYHLGGTGQVVPSSSPTALSAHLLVWKHVGGNRYEASMKFYRYDANGVAVGFNIITNELVLNDEGDEYAGSGVAEFFTIDGQFQFAVCPQFVATRFTG
jgi:hypothetical protein